MSAVPNGYRRSQILLHWFVFVLVAFLFFTGDNMTDAFRAMLKTGANSVWIPVHIIAGLCVFAAMIARLALRRSLGAPPPPDDEAAPLRIAAIGVHGLLYLDLLLAPLVGLVAFFLAPSAGGVHEFMVRLPLMALVGLHVLGALWHHFIKRDSVMTRMVRPISG